MVQVPRIWRPGTVPAYGTMVILPSRGLSPFPFPFPVPALASVHVLSSPSSISLEDFRLSRLSGSWSWIILVSFSFSSISYFLFSALSFLVCPSMPQYALGSDLPRVSPALCQTSNQSLEPQPCTHALRYVVTVIGPA
jgi:hypothetical protein